jgi:hypothetical protein
MRKLLTVIAVVSVAMMTSCDQTTKKDNTTHDADTMVIRENHTDSATNSISTDTTKR